ncbi:MULTISPECIES: hypothetical protein [Nocardia]|uniref:hypothetical protein n=1 Tax=Nocardia TaxID=1817 RepID=UPI0002FF5612|nr:MULTISPECIES: hypothetical protein [Nocardia]
MDSADRIIITADHGNDPAAGTGHTYEFVPVLDTRPPTLDGTAGLAWIAHAISTALLGYRPTRHR